MAARVRRKNLFMLSRASVVQRMTFGSLDYRQADEDKKKKEASRHASGRLYKYTKRRPSNLDKLMVLPIFSTDAKTG